MQLYANIFVRTVLTDLLHTSCQLYPIDYIVDEQQFRTLSCVHYTIFSVVKSDLFIRALLLDRILVTEKNTRTPRVHLVITHTVVFLVRAMEMQRQCNVC